MADYSPDIGELAGSVTVVQMPNIPCSMVRFKALTNNAGNVYLGTSLATVPNGVTDTNGGFPLAAGDDTGFIPCDNLNLYYRICDNAGDDLVYWSL